jgi:hypothetical protein
MLFDQHDVKQIDRYIKNRYKPEEVNGLKKTASIPCVLFMAAFCFAEDEGVRIIPLLNYESVSLENQQYHVPGGGYIFYSREVYDANYSRPTGIGFFIKVEMLYQFKLN